jgi:hypothetical protein
MSVQDIELMCALTCVELTVRSVIMFGEGLFQGESNVVYAPSPSPRIEGQLIPRKTQPIDLVCHVLIGPRLR